MDHTGGSGGRKKWVSGDGKGVNKRGSGLGSSGPVGSQTGYSDRKPGNGNRQSIQPGAGGGQRRTSGGGRNTGKGVGLSGILIAVVVFFLSQSGLFSGGSSDSSWEGQSSSGIGNLLDYLSEAGSYSGTDGWGSSQGSTYGGNYSQGGGYGSTQSGNSGNYSQSGSSGAASQSGSSGNSSQSSPLLTGSNSGVLNRSVSDAARDKYTVLKGNGRDKVTIMVYMCGTDLESRSGMATSDLSEMAAATLGSNVNLLVYTGGCTRWKNDVVSSSKNQIYQVKNGGLVRLVDDAGSVSMTKPETLESYIEWCAENYPADRYQLIFWDHGGGSVSGYGYDEKYPRTGSMTLAGINQALKNAGVQFDFIGFDACLMATAENALMLSQYADYMIASEETEPGYGWYYTNWLTSLSGNTAISTLDLGKQIADDFLSECTKKGQGQKVTLSVVDLAELQETAPDALTSFAQSTGDLVRNENYKVVSNARSSTREFAQSSKIDQVDLIHLAKNIGTEAADELAEILLEAVKYNLTSRSMTNAYGLSIYFPYQKVSSVDEMVSTYEQIGMDSEYARCIQDFASLEVSGQIAAGGSSSPLPTLLGGSGGGIMDGDLLGQLLGSFLSGGYSDISGLTGSNSGFFTDRILENAAEYVSAHQFDSSDLVWETTKEGIQVLSLSDEQWDMIQNLELNLFYDDGEGYVDLGLDNIYQFDEDGNLIADNDHTWLAINDQPIAYYFTDEVQNGEDSMITGRVPALLNGERVNLILIFDSENPYGYIAGAQTDYSEDVTQTIAKGLTELEIGDQLDFLCDYYTYDGEFQDSYYLGDPMTVEEEMVISNVNLGEGDIQATYRLTDIYNQHYWTPPMD